MQPVMPRAGSRPADLVVLAFAMGLPSLAAWAYFDALAGSGWMLPVYGVSKAIQFSLPIVWVLAFHRERLAGILSRPRGVLLGLGTGAGILALILASHFLVVAASPVSQGMPERLREKLVEMGADTPARYFALSFFLAVIHSFLEEYYWRWFVYGELRRWIGVAPALVLSSLAFMGHHVIVIDTYIADEYFWSATMTFSLSVAVGGAVWAWLYERTESLWGPWVSHVFADIAILIGGYHLVFGRPWP